MSERELTDADRAWLLRFGDTCDAEVSRKGTAEPCEKPAVAAKFDPSGGAYAVCAYHASGSGLISLPDLLRAKFDLEVSPAVSS